MKTITVTIRSREFPIIFRLIYHQHVELNQSILTLIILVQIKSIWSLDLIKC